MKSHFILGIIFCSFCLSMYAQRKIDVLHYKYELELSDKSDTIKGKASITIKFLQDIDTFALGIKSQSAVNEFGLHAMLMNEDKYYMASVYFSNDKFNIIPSRKIKAGDTRTYLIYYDGIPGDGLIISKNKFGKRTFFSDNWPDRAHNWIPCNDDPGDKASVEFFITAPSHYKVVANGILQEEKELPGNKKLTQWKEDVPLPTKVMAIGVADFAVDQKDTVNNIPVSSWVFEQNKNDGFKDYAPAAGILSFFINYIGPYPYKKLANVQSKTIFGGMENAGAIFYAENSVDGTQSQERLMAHEIVHQWFGDMATEKNFSHLWLSEGFATYLAHIYIESKYGTDSLNNEMKKDRFKVLGFGKIYKHPVVDSISSYMLLLNNNSYEKGSWILHMLRRQLGDSVFHQSIKEYYATFAGKNADTHDLENVFEKVSGKDLSDFFQQWLYFIDNPSINIKWRYSEPDKAIMLIVTQLQENIFRFPLDIAWKSASGKMQAETLRISKRTETFSFSAAEKMTRIIPDPNTSLLTEIIVENIK
ncbi:MAG: M1 family metallopeptidase [Chitinophagaceae bacterium]